MTKKIKENLDKIIQIRVSDHEKNRLRHIADMWYRGNMSLMLVSCAMNCPREFLKTAKQYKNRNRKKEGHLSVPYK